jgi:serine/threonine protein kinase
MTAGEADGLFIPRDAVHRRDRPRGDAQPRRVTGYPHIVDMLRPVADALDAAHSRGLVHADVEPGNIIVSSAPIPHRPDHVFLTDFGITKRAAWPSGLTAPGAVGTIDYIAPEQIVGAPVTAQTDQYALGWIAYQCLTGSVPFSTALLTSGDPYSADRLRAGFEYPQIPNRPSSPNIDDLR